MRVALTPPALKRDRFCTVVSVTDTGDGDLVSFEGIDDLTAAEGITDATCWQIVTTLSSIRSTLPIPT